MARARDSFTTIRTEGAILPPDLLRRVRDNDKDLVALTPQGYHLPGNMRLGEAASRAWNALLGAWASFEDARAALPIDDLGTTITRQKWLLPLFQELNYGRLRVQTYEPIDGKEYPISHGYGHVPLHLVGHNVDLETRKRGVAGAARTSPHSLVQELLNRSDQHLWGVVSNGLRLRILRDNLNLTRQAYVEFDLEAMMQGEVYSDFVLLWLVLHQSRLESERPEDAVLEQWSKQAAEQGARALDTLRNGVEKAISHLGRGFLAHPANGALRDELKRGELSTQDYYRELLRLVYRLLFLFVAEDRELLLTPDAGAQAKARYDYYSTKHLRELADRIPGGRHADLYEGLKLVMRSLGSNDGTPALGLPPLGGFLFSERATHHLSAAGIANGHLLQAVRTLAYVTSNQGRRPVDYKNLGSEELGSIYESLLELRPRIDADAASFRLEVAAGNERKTTGSYYTPTSLISLLLDSALDPVVEDAARGKSAEEAEKALLNLKIVDPSCGSGHFLIAAAQRMAKRLAAVRTGDDEPAPEATRSALRDVIGRCVYGVDINEMAAELCKVALWMEALEPGKPLTFLDHRIQVGNSLFGTTAELIKAGIPDDAYKTLEGDNKDLAKAAKARNKKERGRKGGQRNLFADAEGGAALSSEFRAMVSLPDDSPTSLNAKEDAYHKLVASEEYARMKLAADAWCAAFVWRMEEGRLPVVTSSDVYEVMDGKGMGDGKAREVQRIARKYAFLHFHAVFPEVFPEEEGGGFDVVLGNPPWERIKLQEKEWFADRRPDIANATPASKRREKIENLKTEDLDLYDAFLEDKRQAEGESHFARNSGVYPLCGRGDINTYALFAERNRDLISGIGRTGFIVPSGIATDATTQYYFQSLVEKKSLVTLYDFENRNAIFEGVHRSYKFALVTLSGLERPVDEAYFCFFALDPTEVRDPEKRFTLSPEDIALLNPNTKNCPIFRTRRDAEITKAIYRRVPVLVNEATGADPWGIKFLRMFDMSNDSGLFETKEELEQNHFSLRGNHFIKDNERYLPLYEAKLMHQFDHCFATYTHKGDTRDITSAEHQDPQTLPIPRYWIAISEYHRRAGFWAYSWLVSWRKIARGTDERTFISTVLPIAGLGDSGILGFPQKASKLEVSSLVGNLSAFVLDYVTRQKLGGTNMAHFITQQLPVLPPDAYTPAELAFIAPRVLELTYTAWDMQPFARDLGWEGAPFVWNEKRRFWLRAELDALYFHLYGVARDDVSYIMETFPIVKKRDLDKYNTYRTKDTILEIYDEMALAKAEGRECQTRLEPPLAHPSLTHDTSTKPEWLK